MTTSSVAPVGEPVLWTLLAWVRREIEQTFSNLTPASTQPVAALIVESPNLLVNPGAELGDPSLSGYSSVTVPGWTVTGTPTVIEYDTVRRFPWPTASPGPTFPAFLAFPTSSSAPPDSGDQFFGGGPVATSTLTQTINLTAAASDIDTGTVPYELSADLGGFTVDPSSASVTVEFLDVNGVTLGSGRIRPVSALDRWFQTGLVERETAGTIPVGTRSARVIVTLQDCNPVLGNYNNAYADNLSFTVGVANLVPAVLTPPVSTVGDLDHVFMVYMENKGFGDIVGSPNAPYLNSLIQQYGFASNYYALTHPSDPNYYPIIGGSDFGFNYNCPANCFDPPVNLTDNIELAHKTWAGYAEGGGGYTTPTDRLPFLAFSDIYDDPDRVATHLFDLTEMAGDLVDPDSAPNFVWFAADDATNMEGPTDTLTGIVRWALSQLTPAFLGGHQYNVAAGDVWLQETLPIIMESNTWNDPSERSVIILTFDEDYNNISLGIGNEGNHIVTVVIPSPGAVAAGMRGGAFVAVDRYDHYSLLRTIEESLDLAPLTNNDEFAQPMNEFWV
jgi:Phosphoesterase family